MFKNKKERLKMKNAFDGNLVFGSKKFNTSTNRKDHLKSVDKTAQVFVDIKTGIIKKNISKRRNCPLCKNNRSSELFNKSGFPHLKCLHCQMIYVSPILKEEKFHSENFNQESYNKTLLTPNQVELDNKKFEYGLDIIEHYSPSKGSILDVGCGPGVFLERAKARGWAVTGIEFNKWCIERLHGLNIPVINCSIEKSTLEDKSFNCITLWTILEHLINPLQVLRNINKKLISGGILLIYVPNIDSLAVRVLHEKCTTFAGHSHINFFNAKTLEIILNKSGYKLIELETHLSEIGTINNYLDFQDPYFGNAKKTLDIITPEYIHENMLGYILFGIAEKI